MIDAEGWAVMDPLVSCKGDSTIFAVLSRDSIRQALTGTLERGCHPSPGPCIPESVLSVLLRCISLSVIIVTMAQSVYIPMTRQARDALIAVSVLWVVCAVVVTLRIVGRFRGAGVSVDDVLSFFALVR